MLRCAAIAVATLIAAACSGPPVGSSAGSTSAPPAEPAAVAPVVVEGGELTVASYNVNFGLAGDGPTIEAIRALGADVVFLQETHRGWERPLRDALADDYPHIEFRHHRTRPGGLAVLSKLAFDAGDVIAETAGSFPAWRVELDSEIGRVQVLNVHLYPPVLRYRPDGWWAAYFESQKTHLAEIKAFIAELDPELPAVVLGDFNEDAGGPAVKHLLAGGFVHALTERTPTWRWDTRFGTIHWELDHILLGPGLRAVAARVDTGGNSDHVPLVATIAAN
jgi:endonuclease/exonuclease/phosphatase (EEP) superfamily protein YafD